MPRSIIRKAYDKAMEEALLLHSKETLSELVQVFYRPKFDKYISIADRARAIESFEKKSFLIDVYIRINACRDIKDNKFLELAVSGDSSFIVTGDKIYWYCIHSGI
jgi:putative PIN family toxin of toxin-antitoxin system